MQDVRASGLKHVYRVQDRAPVARTRAADRLPPADGRLRALATLLSSCRHVRGRVLDVRRAQRFVGYAVLFLYLWGLDVVRIFKIVRLGHFPPPLKVDAKFEMVILVIAIAAGLLALFGTFKVLREGGVAWTRQEQVMTNMVVLLLSFVLIIQFCIFGSLTVIGSAVRSRDWRFLFEITAWRKEKDSIVR